MTFGGEEVSVFPDNIHSSNVSSYNGAYEDSIWITRLRGGGLTLCLRGEAPRAFCGSLCRKLDIFMFTKKSRKIRSRSKVRAFFREKKCGPMCLSFANPEPSPEAGYSDTVFIIIIFDN